MPGLPQRNVQLCNSHSSSCSAGSDFSNGIWSKHRDDITFDQLQKFWSGLSPHARQKLLRIDKQTLLEQARKNLYCSRCNGLLLEGFSQIVMYGKSLHQEGAFSGQLPVGNSENPKNQNDCKSNIMLCQDDTQDPSVHPWGGLAATRDGILTLLDCFLGAKSLKALQNVFDSARARERERELLYPDACGGGGRGWISLGMANYGRGHGTRETCALHTARLSCDTLVDFWSALGDETRRSLLRMKEEDFIERLMFRFDSKRFCRDCRRNVIREFKELKELKRMRREPRCNSWFCAADTAFEYEVSDDTVQASWYESFSDIVGTYHHFEWAIGTGEGKSDILEFEDVGMTGSVEIDGLDLSDLSACFITLRAWKLDGRCTELSVKAHAVKGQPCVHRRLVVGDGYVTISKGESIRRFFEHAEEAEEEEDDDSMDKDGNEVDGESTRPQKHAKSPELAREFLLDAATVIFKEQVEKAFREGTARQNAHSIFVCLALKLLEERVHVACKEIITLEKQSKLLEEEEKEKREEEERKERRRTKEREKKLRRKERLKGKEKEIEKDLVNQNHLHCVSNEEESSSSVHEEAHNASNSGESISETGDLALSRPLSPDIQDEQSSSSYKDDSLQNFGNGEPSSRDGGGFISSEQFNFSRRKSKARKEFQDNSPPVDDQKSNGGYTGIPPRCVNGVTKHTRSNPARSNSRNYGHNLSEKFCSCYNTQSEYRSKDSSHVTTARPNGAIRTTISRDVKKVWEPIESRKIYVRSNPDSYVASKSSTFKVDECEEGGPSNEDDSVAELQIHEPYGDLVEDKISGLKNNGKEERDSDHSNGFILGTNSSYYLKETAESCPTTNTCSVNDVSSTVLKSTSSSDNCSSCLSEADSSKASSSSTQTAESWSTSDSEDASPQSEEKQTSSRGMNDFMKYQDFEVDENHKKYQDFEVNEIHKPNGGETLITEKKTDFTPPTVDPPAQNVHLFDHNGKISMEMGLQQHQTFQSVHNTQGIQLPIFPAPSTMAYYHQNPASWSAAPVENGFMQYPHQPNHSYLFTNPFGYGVSLNQPSQYAIRYSPLQPLTTSMFNMGQVPVYQPINRSSSDEEAKNVKRVGPFQEAADAVKVEKQHPIDRPVSSNRTRPEAASANEQNGCTTRSGNVKNGTETENFSLFHFGLPTAARTGSNNPQKTSHASQVDISLDTKIEEYSLFSSGNNRTLFSFF